MPPRAAAAVQSEFELIFSRVGDLECTKSMSAGGDGVVRNHVEIPPLFVCSLVLRIP